MGILALLAVVLSLLLHFLHRTLGVFSMSMAGSQATPVHVSPVLLNVVMLLPVLCAVVMIGLYFFDTDNRYLPLVTVLSLTFSSISMVSGSGGDVVFHFSIFMVLAIAAFYEDIRLLLVMTGLFAIEHLVGFFFLPGLVFGVNHYPLLMMLMHALFLVLTSGATSWLIYLNKRTNEELAQQTNERRMQLQFVLGNIRQSAGNLAELSATLSSGAEQSVRASEQVSITMTEIATGAETQVRSVGHMEQALQSLERDIQTINESSDMTTQMALGANLKTKQGNEEITDAERQMDTIKEKMDELVAHMKRLSSNSTQIDRIVDAIRLIADETNLLALNASIEAARAGDAGRGFAVVASEVGKLASESSLSVKQIGEIIEEVQRDIYATTEAVEQSVAQVSQGVASIQSAGRAFREIGQAIDSVASHVSAVSESTHHMVQQTQTVVSAVQDVQTVTSITAAGTQEASAASQEQMASMEEIAAAAASIAQTAEEMVKTAEQVETSI